MRSINDRKQAGKPAGRQVVYQFEFFFRRLRRELPRTMTTPHVIKAMIPATREVGKKIAAMQATNTEPHAIAL